MTITSLLLQGLVVSVKANKLYSRSEQILIQLKIYSNTKYLLNCDLRKKNVWFSDSDWAVSSQLKNTTPNKGRIRLQRV